MALPGLSFGEHHLILVTIMNGMGVEKLLKTLHNVHEKCWLKVNFLNLSLCRTALP